MRGAMMWVLVGCSAEAPRVELPASLARAQGPAPVVVELVRPEGSPRDRARWVADVAAIQDAARQCAPGLVEDRVFTNVHALSGLADAETLTALAACPVVVDVGEPRRFDLHVAESVPLIQADAAVALTGFDGTGTAVAVLDTGVNYTHTDLGGCLGAGCKVAYGYDFADGDDDPSDCLGHGTNVAGIAAGLSGVAPGADILAMKIAEDADCYAIDERAIASAVDEAVTLAEGYAHVSINMSFGSGLYDEACDFPGGAMGPAMKDAFEAGLSLVASAGNDGDPDRVGFPACMTAVLGVANSYDANVGWAGYCLDASCASTCIDAATAADMLNCSSNGGAMVDVAAPGTVITAAGVTMSGTSQASPHVAGAMALLGQAVPDATPEDRYGWVLRSDTTLLDTRSSTLYSYPRLDLISAFEADIDGIEATITAVDDDDLDGTSGDGDGVVEAGETVGLDLEIWNGSPGSLTDLRIDAWTDDPDLIFSDDRASLAGLAPDERAAPEDAPDHLLFSVPATCVTDHSAAFTLGFTANELGAAEQALSLDLRCVIDDDADGWLWTEDCDDLDASIAPDAVEVCDGVDQDCDGEVDEDATDASTFYADADADGYGDAAVLVMACELPEGAVDNAEDCDDLASGTFPGAAETCDEADQDCDGEVDEGEVCAAPAPADPGGCGCGGGGGPGAGLLVGLAALLRRRATPRRDRR